VSFAQTLVPEFLAILFAKIQMGGLGLKINCCVEYNNTFSGGWQKDKPNFDNQNKIFSPYGCIRCAENTVLVSILNDFYFMS